MTYDVSSGTLSLYTTTTTTDVPHLFNRRQSSEYKYCQQHCNRMHQNKYIAANPNYITRAKMKASTLSLFANDNVIPNK